MSQQTSQPSASITDLYGHRVRVRVCGLYRENDRLLMVKHRNVGQSGTFWAPPGGGIEFGETAMDALRREWLEETGLIIDAGRLLCVYEFVQPPLHAIELFLDVRRATGELKLGADPEMGSGEQILLEARMMTFEQIKALPVNDVHGLFSRCQSLDELFRLDGFIYQH